MKRVAEVDYGRGTLKVTLEDDWNVEVISPLPEAPVADAKAVLKARLNNPIGTDPLRAMLSSRRPLRNVTIVISDSTRPVPSAALLEALVEELAEAGVDGENVTLLVATGLHRRTRPDEQERMLGPGLNRRLGRRVVDHVATDASQLCHVGDAGSHLYVNKHYVESDFKILTGCVEPHLFAGFSGGRKSIMPGISGEAAIHTNHSPENLTSPRAHYGLLEGNPVHEGATAVARAAGADFILNVCINSSYQIAEIAAGDLEMAFDHLADYQRRRVFRRLEAPADIVVCGCGRYPLDLNLYQGAKGMALGELAVKDGGTIISVNEHCDGVGHSHFKEVLHCGKPAAQIHREILEGKARFPDQWQVQILCRVMEKADVHVVSSLPAEELGNIGLKHAATVEEAIRTALDRHGKDARILIFPNGAQVIPYVA